MPTRPRKKAVRKAPVRLAPDERTTVIQSMRTDFLQCRDFGHSWRPYSAHWLPDERCYESLLRCSRCRTIRNRYIGQDGRLLSSNYDYADGYVVKGLGRLDGEEKNLLRLASIEKVLVEDTAEENA